jgi:hypothetical protein
MDVRKLWDNTDSSEYKSVCDVYGAEHLARLIGTYHRPLHLPQPVPRSPAHASQFLSPNFWPRQTWISSPCRASERRLASLPSGWDATARRIS